MAMLPVQAPEQGPVHEIRPRLARSAHRGLAGRSDEGLVSIARDGDERAFEILYERHSAAIHRYCRSLLRSTQEAEDVKQEVFVLAISALRRGARPDAFRPWLYRVAHNACMSHLRARRPVLVADNGVLVGPAAAAEPVEHHREELRQLLDDIGKLPDVQRGALLLREMDGFSYEQVGEVLGLSLSTVRASIFRARRTLQGLAEARDADCEVIQSELCELADRRGRRGRHITSHLTVCSNCRDFRDGLRRRPAVLSGIAPVGPLGPGGLLLALKGKLLGGAAAGGGTGTALATAGGGAGAAKIAAVAVSSIALLASAGVEAARVIDHGRRDAAATPRHAVVSRAARTAPTAAGRATVAAAAVPVVPSTDIMRAGGALTADRPNASSTGSRTRAHAHGNEAGAEHGTGGRAAPSAAAPAADTTSPTAGAREHEPGETTSTGVHGRHRGSDADEDNRDDAVADGSGRSGSDRGQEADDASPRSGPSDDAPRSGPSPTDDADEAPGTPAPTRSENSGPSPAPRPAPDETSAGTTPQDSSGTPAPAPEPAPEPAPAPAPPPDPAAPVDPAPEPTADAGTAAATVTDPSAVTALPQP